MECGIRNAERTEDEGRWTRDEKRTSEIRTVRDLNVYRKAFDSAMEKKADSFCPPLLLATYRAVARRAKTEAVILRPSS